MKIEAFTLVFEDYVTDEYDTWSQLCDTHILEVYDSNSDDVKRHIREWEGVGICGVEGCNNEAEHYINFR